MLRLLSMITALTLVLTPAARAEQVLRMAHDLGFGASTTMDPYDPNRFWPTINIVYEGLIALTSDNQPIPRLATEWSSSPDLKTWTFKLRDGVTFHDGSAFDAADVAFSFNRMIDKEFDSPVRAVLGVISEIKVVDPLTVEFHLSAPEADFLLLVGDYRAMILPEGMTGEMAKTAPVGTGPFKVETLSPEGTTVLAAFPEFHGGAPKLARIEMSAIPDSSARIQALLAGQIDMLATIDSKQEPLFAGNPQFVLQHIPSGDWNAIVFQVDQKPFDDVRVRKALRMAVDREEMVKILLGEGNGVPACDTPVWSRDANRWDGTCPRDVEGAKKLLAEAGYPDGIDIEIFTSDVEENMVQIVEVYQAQVAEAGIRVKLTMTASDGFWDTVWMQKPAFVDSWGQRPATQVLNEVYRSTASWNVSNWKVPEFDAMLDKARAEPDAAKRKALYGEIQQKLYEEGGILAPYHKTLLRVISARIKGIEVPFTPDNIPWQNVEIADE
jgi:peptide/nickel transport system substrate-binding protein